jgi:hypothetical protein
MPNHAKKQRKKAMALIQKVRVAMLLKSNNLSLDDFLRELVSIGIFLFRSVWSLLVVWVSFRSLFTAGRSHKPGLGPQN